MWIHGNGQNKDFATMKHALLILWHKDAAQLERLLKFFDDDFDCFIHIDRKSRMTQSEREALEKAKGGLHLFCKYNIRWGGISIVKAELFLLGKIIASGKEYDYIHFMSGQDYPIKKLCHIKNYFEEHNGYEFVEYMQLPSGKWEQGTLRRFRYYLPNDFIDSQSPSGSKLSGKLVEWQRRLGIRRSIPDQFERLYGGSNWMSITGQCATYIVNNRKRHKAFYNRLKYTFAPDEVYFHTVILNSGFAQKTVNNNLRCIIWPKSGASPLTLTEREWWNIATSDRLFARKLDSKRSASLIALIDKYILADETIDIATQGQWRSETFAGHCYDNGLAEGLLHLLPLMGIKTIADLGCGPGWYVALFRRNGYEADGYDGNPNVEKMSAPLFANGFYCQCANLTDELEAEEPFELVFSLEVGEHIPAKWENTYIDNLTRNSTKFIIVSWAIEGQKGDGHVNCHSNIYIIEKMRERGFTFNTPASNYLRKCATLFWLKHTIMVFEKLK